MIKVASLVKHSMHETIEKNQEEKDRTIKWEELKKEWQSLRGSIPVLKNKALRARLKEEYHEIREAQIKAKAGNRNG